MEQTIPDGATVIDLRGLQPAPERLLDVLNELESPGGYVFDFGDAMPWSRHLRFESVTFPETLVARTADVVGSRGSRFYLALRSPFPAATREVGSLRHLVRAARADAPPRFRPALRKFVSDTIDDVLELIPSLVGIVSLRESAGAEASPADERDEGAWQLYREELNARELQFQTVSHEQAHRLNAASDLLLRDGTFTGSLEDRLPELGVAGRLPSDLHPRLRAWRSIAWARIGACYEELARGEREPLSRDTAAVSVLKAARSHLRAFSALSADFTEAYTGLCSPRDLQRFLARIHGPVRERVGDVAARLSLYRAVR